MKNKAPMATPPAPPDLSTCDTCRRPVPPTTHPDFANWSVTKSEETGRVTGMRCPQCQAKTGVGDPGASGGA